MELMTAHRTWIPTYNDLTPEQLQEMVSSGLTTDWEILMWRKDLLRPQRLNHLLQLMTLVCLDLPSAPVQ